jgi:hypothetical protein
MILRYSRENPMTSSRSVRFGAKPLLEALTAAVQSEEPSSSSWRECKMTSKVQGDGRKIHVLTREDINTAVVCQHEQSIDKIILYVGERTDKDNNPSRSTVDYSNTILSTLENLCDIPRIRVYYEKERCLYMIGGWEENSPRTTFCKDYNDMCVITFSRDFPCGFELTT